VANKRALSPFKIVKNEAGAALMMALFTVMVLFVIATEVMYQTTVEAKVSSQSINQVKAYYAAKAGIEIGLFRVFVYRSVVSGLQSSGMADKMDMGMLDLIWTFPFSWPPQAPDAVGMATKDQIQKSVKSSLMQANYALFIDSEGSKIDINDLASESEKLRDMTRKLILQIFSTEMENNPDFVKKTRGMNFEKIVNNIKDWIDEDKQAEGGGDEKGPYADLNNEDIPPNQPMKTIGELHMVAGVTDDIYDLLAPRLTVFGTKGINVNHASEEVLQAIDAQITPEKAKLIVAARNNPDRGPFKNMEDFTGFLSGSPINMDTTKLTDGKEAKVPLIFDAEYNFRIRAVGKSGPVQREITAITYDIDAVKERYETFLPTPTPGQNGGKPPPPPGTPTPTPKPTMSAPKQPNIVYWSEI
jgi:general secretion pathway protein K